MISTLQITDDGARGMLNGGGDYDRTPVKFCITVCTRHKKRKDICVSVTAHVYLYLRGKWGEFTRHDIDYHVPDSEHWDLEEYKASQEHEDRVEEVGAVACTEAAVKLREWFRLNVRV